MPEKVSLPPHADHGRFPSLDDSRMNPPPQEKILKAQKRATKLAKIAKERKQQRQTREATDAANRARSSDSRFDERRFQ